MANFAKYPLRRKLFLVLLFLVLITFVFFPDIVSHGAKLGLMLWFEKVLPALLPFMILSTFMIRQNITDGISRVTAPVFSKVFGISRTGCYPVVIGFLSGYPVGARTVADLYQKGKYSKEEAQYLLSFCNNASPMFLTEYIGVECMQMAYPLEICFVIYLSAWISSLWGRRRLQGEGHYSVKTQQTIKQNKRERLMIALDGSILDAFVTITKVGGYIILFSIVTEAMEELLPISEMIKYIGIGILEITTGGKLFADLELTLWVKKGILISLCAFGGLSSIAQTASVLCDTDLEIKGYIIAKIRQALIALILGFLLTYVMGQ